MTRHDLVVRARRAASDSVRGLGSLRAARSRGCLPHRAVLLEVLEGRPRDHVVAAALDHVVRCRVCEREAGELALVITGLRRLGAAARRVEPRPDGWSRFVARLNRGRWAGLRASLAPLAGMLAVPLMLAVLIAPGAGSQGGAGDLAASDITSGPAVADAVPDAPALSAARAAATRRLVNVDDPTAQPELVPDATATHGPLPDGLTLQQGPSQAATGWGVSVIAR